MDNEAIFKSDIRSFFKTNRSLATKFLLVGIAVFVIFTVIDFVKEELISGNFDTELVLIFNVLPIVVALALAWPVFRRKRIGYIGLAIASGLGIVFDLSFYVPHIVLKKEVFDYVTFSILLLLADKILIILLSLIILIAKPDISKTELDAAPVKSISPYRWLWRDIYITTLVFLFIIAAIWLISFADTDFMIFVMALASLNILVVVVFGLLLFRTRHAIAVYALVPLAIFSFIASLIVLGMLLGMFSGDMAALGFAIILFPGIFCMLIYSIIYAHVLYKRKIKI